MNYTRAEINLDTVQKVREFVALINSDGTTDRYVLESADGTYRADARSLLGVMYAAGDYKGIYLVNTSNDGKYPHGVDEFRA